MVKIILNREELSMVLGWIGSAQVRAKERDIPWDDFEKTILKKFRKAMGFKEEIKLKGKGGE